MATIICPHCGELISDGSAICSNCGYQVTPTIVAAFSREKLKNKLHFMGQRKRRQISKLKQQLSKHKWLLVLFGILFTGLIIGGVGHYQALQTEHQIQAQLTAAIKSLRHETQTQAAQKPQGHTGQVLQKTNRPIILLHGFGGTYNSEKYVIASLSESHHAKQHLMVYVDSKSRIHYVGNYPSDNSQREIVPIVIANKYAGEFYYSKMLAKIMPELNQRYHITNYDAIGHSMGSYAWINYFEEHPKQTAKIKPHRIVTIAGPFDGILNRHKADQPSPHTQVGRLWDDYVGQNSLGKSGRPAIQRPEYKHLLKSNHRLPANLSILNIYGDLKDGTNSDGLVTTTSARSLGYLVKTSHVKIGYKERKVTGSRAQHSRLHYNNLAVNHLINNFLLYK
ncbi:alpha/beta hydrolase [Lactobacillus sp. LC28-10]|uniref:Alpha/beta hydrolase n=1 Tax=Secundilactobacillus angelensis TaxID=2722706 RepID=A0ABX1KYY2_9LACO|nr:alpha/beta hydrolase [Secundilactobacillus angelensis]MCH5462732.1 alpha/beta hydrolase [Secundilactobacillus angelensis]NLR18844.1 alpha/beta hydrolase [Secundilactobacillus angelensis]